MKCTKPPKGWHCTRDKDHEGPCAARSTLINYTQPIILYRDFDIEDNERIAMNQNFHTFSSRSLIQSDSLVIGRFSVLPFYKELVKDLGTNNSKLINSWEQHSFVADIGQWYSVIKDYTPETWSMRVGTNNLPTDCSFVLKGATNSIKRLWTTHMFARTRADISDVYGRLLDDTMIGQQEIFARRYMPLRKLGESVNGMPITEEYRFFICYEQVISGGFYWSSHVNDVIIPKWNKDIIKYVEKVARLIGDKCNFYTIDIGITEEGNPIVIELNDGQMAGLSENDPFVMYKNLKDIIKEKY